MESRDKTLLPAGIYDQLSPVAMQHRGVSDALLSSFESFGYEYVNPPLVECESGLLSGTGAELSSQTFRLMDPISHTMLAVRSDITVQIARLATTRLCSEAMPLRLSYAGDVLRVSGGTFMQDRQLTQAGIELIGCESHQADVEVVRVMIDALQKIGVRNLSVDFNLPKLRDSVIDPLNLESGDRAKLEDAIAKKDPKLIRLFGGKQAELILKLVSPTITLDDLLSLSSLPKEAKLACKELQRVTEAIHEALPEVGVTVDPLEARNSGYHSGIGFSIFARGAKGEIGRGGRYLIPESDGKGLQAVGCTLYVNALQSLLPAKRVAKRVLVSLDASEAEAVKLRAEGIATVYALEVSKNWEAEAKRLGCDDVLL